MFFCFPSVGTQGSSFPTADLQPQQDKAVLAWASSCPLHSGLRRRQGWLLRGPGGYMNPARHSSCSFQSPGNSLLPGLPARLSPSCFHLSSHSRSLALATEALGSGLLAGTLPPEGSHADGIRHILWGSGHGPSGQSCCCLPWAPGPLATVSRGGGQAVGNIGILGPAPLSWAPSPTPARIPLPGHLDLLRGPQSAPPYGQSSVLPARLLPSV